MPETIQPGNKQNVATGKDVRTRSRFKLDYHMFDTFRFGELHPHFVMECVPGDRNVNVRSEHNLRTYSLSAPLMQRISLKKDYFAVPMEAILPFNWDKIYTNPIIGDDVPDDAGTYVDAFSYKVYNFLLQTRPTSATIQNGTIAQFNTYYTNLFRWFLTAELFYSNGNLMSSLGIHLSHLCQLIGYTKHSGPISYNSFDKCFDDLMLSGFQYHWTNGKILRLGIKADSEATTLTQYFNVDAIGLRRVLEIARDNLGTFVLACTATESATFLLNNPDIRLSVTTSSEYDNIGINLDRLFAYQIVCAHYYTDDHVDYIYSAELYRQYINSIFDGINLDGDGFSLNYPFTFTYNGVSFFYDYLSALGFTEMINHTTSESFDRSMVLSYLQAIFGYRQSLRYKDYFVGSRTQPLAVGDVNVAVADNKVSVMENVQKTMLARFLNAVNRGHRKLEPYIGELFGVHVKPDYHNPFFLGHTMDEVYGQEVENTGEAQQSNPNSITTVLRSNASKYAFEFDADRPCIILGISYFDIPRSYWETIERQNFHKDRFDMFNPYMQFIGDQKVLTAEISPANKTVSDDIFGYQLRHAEYKQRYNQASGGFVENLPGYAFLNDYGLQPVQTRLVHQGPSFIRSRSTELDRFYISLTGFSLGSYFHFIVDNYNDVSASRPMVYAPSIL